MARLISTELHSLIHSMTKDEKRMFKTHALQTLPKKNTISRRYLILFDFINRQKIYDEANLLTTLKEIKHEHLPGYKNYLYNHILQSLEQSQSHSSVDIIIHKQINQIHILYNKGLHEQSEKLLNKTIRLGMKYEKVLLLAELYNWKKKLALFKPSSGQEASIAADEKKIYDKILTEKEYYRLWIKSAEFLAKRRASRNRTEKSEWLEKIGHSEYVKEEKKANSFLSRRLFHYLNATNYFIIGNDEKLKYYAFKLIEHFRNNPHQIEDDPDGYIVALNNYIVGLVLFNHYKEATHELLEFKEFTTDKKLTPISRAKVFGFYYSHLINIGSYRLDFLATKKHVDDFEELLPKHLRHFRESNLIVIYFNIITLLFTHAEFKKALHWINRMFNEFSVDTRKDLQSISWLISIIINHELGNHELADSQIKSTRHR